MSSHIVKPPKRPRDKKNQQFPIELYDEIISFLWNDLPALKSCALANRILTAPSQKRLFYCIVLDARFPHRNRTYEGACGADGRFTKYVLTGTSSNFYKLLAGSPHLAEYIQALHILDSDYPIDSHYSATQLSDFTLPSLGNEYFNTYKLMNGEEILDLNDASKPHDDPYEWLAKDQFFPRFAPLLCNLKALRISHFHGWQNLTYRVLFTLLHLIRLPSLVYLRVNCSDYLPSMFDMTLGVNVKHLSVDTYGADQFPLRIENPPLGAVHLETFYTNKPSQVLQTSRIQFSRLRNLAIKAFAADEHVAIQQLLQRCRYTLEDFVINPATKVTQELTSGTDIVEKMDPISFAGLTSLKRFAVLLKVSQEHANFLTPFPWLRNLLRSGYSTSVIQRLKELSIQIYIESSYTLGVQANVITQWKPLFDILLEEEFKNLQILNIFIASFEPKIAKEVLEILNFGLGGVAELRCRPGLMLNIRASNHSFRFDQDVRWESGDWRMWGKIDME